MRSRYRVILAIILILVAAALIRVQRLDDSFFGDEIFHVVTADSWRAGEGLSLGGAHPYSRAALQTYAVALSMELLGDSEWAARILSLLASLVAIVLVFEIGKRWFGSAVGLVAATYLALEPWSVHYGSFARFYAATQVTVLLAVLGLERVLALVDALSGAMDRRERHRSMVAVLGWGGLAGASLAVGLSLQVLAGDLLLGFLGFAAIRIMFWITRGEGRRALRSPELLTLGLALVGASGLVLLAPGLVESLRESAMAAQPWNQRDGLAPLFYAYHLRESYPLEWFLLPVGIVVAISIKHRRGLLTTCLFLVPLVVHSLVLRPKSPHYLFPVMPFLFLLTAVALVELARLLGKSVATNWSRGWRVLALALMAAFLLRSSPWLNRSLYGQVPYARMDWRTAVERVLPEIGEDDLIVGGLDDNLLAFRYYMPRVDAHLATKGWYAQSLPVDWDPSEHPPGAGIFGIPSWTTIQPIFDALEEHPRAWIFAYSRRFRPTDQMGEILVELKRRASRVIETEGQVTIVVLDRQVDGSPHPREDGPGIR